MKLASLKIIHRLQFRLYAQPISPSRHTQPFPNMKSADCPAYCVRLFLLFHLTKAVTCSRISLSSLLIQAHYFIRPTLLVTLCQLSYRKERSRFSGRPNALIVAGK